MTTNPHTIKISNDLLITGSAPNLVSQSIFLNHQTVIAHMSPRALKNVGNHIYRIVSAFVNRFAHASTDCRSTEDRSGIRVFISYSNKDESYAADLKNKLSACRIDAFVAHLDMDGKGSNVDQVIERKIRQCNVFLALISADYCRSSYAQYEFGMAVGSKRTILPIRVDDTAPSFIGAHRYLNCDKTFPDGDITEIMLGLMLKMVGRIWLTDALIREFGGKNHADAAAWLIELRKRYGFTEEQNNRITEVFLKRTVNHHTKITRVDEELVAFYLWSSAAGYVFRTDA